MLSLSIAIITKFLTHKKTDPELIGMIKLYLYGKGKNTMSSICRWARYEDLAEVHDSLGWDNFVEGRIPSCYLNFHRRCLEEEGKAHVEKNGDRV